MRALVLLSTLLIAVPAAAAPSLEERYKAAVKLEVAGNVVDALAAFEAIPVEKRDFNTRLHIASCKRKLGRMLEAAKDYEWIRDDPNADVPTKETAASDLDVLRAATPRLRVTSPRTIEGLVVEVDGGPVKLPVEVMLDPGPHRVTARRGEKTLFERKVALVESTKIEVVVDLPAEGSSPVSAPSSVAAPPAARADHPTDWRVPTGLVIGGLGVAALGLSVWSALRVPALEEERDDLAARGDAAAHERAADARSAQTVGRVALATGVVALGVGTFLVLTSKSEKTVAQSVKISPTAGTWGLRVEASW